MVENESCDTFHKLKSSARLYLLIDQIISDQEFIRSGDGRRIIYVPDNDVLNMFAEPISDSGLRYMRLFETFGTDDVVQSQLVPALASEPHGTRSSTAPTETDRSRALLYATAWITGDDIFLGKFSKDLLLLDSYRRELSATAESYHRRAIRSLPDLLSKDSIEKFERMLKELADKGDPDDEFYVKLQKFCHAIPFVLTSVLGEKAAPLGRIACAIQGYGAANSNYIEDMIPPDPSSAIWSDLFDRLKVEAPRRDEDNLAADVDGILYTSNLNALHGDNVRFLFLTGDRAIHSVMDGIYAEGAARAYGFPSYNFIRRPVQMSAFLQGNPERDGADGIIEAAKSIKASLALFLGLGVGSLEQKVYRAIYAKSPKDTPWPIPLFAPDRGAGRVMRFYLGEIFSSIRRSRQAALAMSAKTLRPYFESVSSYTGTVGLSAATVSESPLVSVALHGIAQEYRQSIERLSMYVRANIYVHADPGFKVGALHEALSLAVRALKGEDVSSRGGDASNSRVWRRMPCFPRFAESLAQGFQDIMHAREFNATDFFKAIERVSVSKVFLFNAFISGMINDWYGAEQQCSQALTHFGAQLDNEERGEYQYFRALAIRHELNPGSERLLEAAREICKAIDGDPDEPRYLVEKAALIIAIGYHKLHYGYDIEYDQGLTPDDVEPLLKRALQNSPRIEERYGPGAEISLRLKTQLYCNFCNITLHKNYLNVKFFRPKSEPSIKELESYVDGLKRSVEDRGGFEKVSYLVRLIYSASRAHVFYEKGAGAKDISKALEELIELKAIIDSQGPDEKPLIIPYDAHKVRDFLAIAEGWIN